MRNKYGETERTSWDYTRENTLQVRGGKALRRAYYKKKCRMPAAMRRIAMI